MWFEQDLNWWPYGTSIIETVYRCLKPLAGLYRLTGWVSFSVVFCDIYVVWAGFKLMTLWNLYHRDSIAVFKAVGRTIPPKRWVSLSTVFCVLYVVWAGFKLRTLWNLYHRDSIAVFKAVGRTIPPNRWVSLSTVFCDIYVVWAGFKLRT